MSEKLQKAQDRSKGVMHIAFGVIYMIMAAVLIFGDQIQFFKDDPTFVYILGGLFAVYGAFRIYRGIKRFTGQEKGW